MKLIEIKNSLAKLYYSPDVLPLVISDFLTIDDKNQKIISQVVSIESTNKENTNCAVLKFSLELQNDTNLSAYSGYVPSLDANVYKTESELINEIFSNKENSFHIGQLTNSTNLALEINAKFLDNFLYIQSDKISETENLMSKLFEHITSKSKKALVLDFEGIKEYQNAKILELGKEFKLPINNEVLNYIYENDLTGLTVEQKAIVQDIILEIQEYTETLEDKFIPFDTLLGVVNDIYESDKSTGVILFRNKLIKYSQLNIFASTKEEFGVLKNTVENNSLTVLKLDVSNTNWQKESFDFVINNLETNLYILFEAKEEITDKTILNKVYKNKQFRPIVFSKYNFAESSLLKSFAKNLALFKPEEQQKAFATYNSFLMKLVDKEFIISGETTFYTPLILKPGQNIIKELAPIEVIEDAIGETDAIEEVNFGQEDIAAFEEIIVENIEEENDLKNIFEESLEQEIAKDIDQMFYVDTASEEEPQDNVIAESEEINYEEMFTDDDLDLLDGLNAEEQQEPTKEDLTVGLSAQLQQEEDYSELSGLDDEDSFEDVGELDELSDIAPLEDFEEKDEPLMQQEVTSSIQIEQVQESLVENNSLPSIPIYKTELDEKSVSDDKIKIAEGNIVYHEKYGRGVVEQLISYGKKTLCSIQFDNVGRRLLDPSLADLKQM